MMRRRDVPTIPPNAIAERNGHWDIYDVGLERWRCYAGTKKIVGFIRYSYNPQEYPDRPDTPWTRDNCWFSSKHP